MELNVINKSRSDTKAISTVTNKLLGYIHNSHEAGRDRGTFIKSNTF